MRCAAPVAVAAFHQRANRRRARNRGAMRERGPPRARPAAVDASRGDPLVDATEAVVEGHDPDAVATRGIESATLPDGVDPDHPDLADVRERDH